MLEKTSNMPESSGPDAGNLSRSNCFIISLNLCSHISKTICQNLRTFLKNTEDPHIAVSLNVSGLYCVDMTNVRAPKLFFFYSETERHCHFHEPQQICFLQPCDDNEDKWVPGMKVKPHEDYSAPQPRMHARSQAKNKIHSPSGNKPFCVHRRGFVQERGGEGGLFRRGIICLCICVLWNVPLFALRRQKPNVSAESVVSCFIICISCHLINLQPLEASTKI